MAPVKRLSVREILAQIPAARRREREERRAGLRAVAARVERGSDRLVLDLSNGCTFTVPASFITALRGLSRTRLRAVELSPSGEALRWEAEDIDVSVPGLLLATFPSADRARELARLAGRATSPAKARAARANGAKGGRPRRTRPAA